MAIESANYISQLDITNPKGTDQYSTVDDQIRLCKKVVKQSFLNVNSEVSATPGHMNQLVGLTGNIQAQIDEANSNIAALSVSLNTEINNNVNALYDRIANTSSTLNTKIDSLSSTMNARISAFVLENSSARRTLSSALQTEIDDSYASMDAAKLDLSATATNSLLWDGSAKYEQSTTPTLSDGEIWFKHGS